MKDSLLAFLYSLLSTYTLGQLLQLYFYYFHEEFYLCLYQTLKLLAGIQL